MRVLYALLCRGTDTNDDGSLNVQGISYQLYARDFPAQQDEITLATAIEWEPHERGRIPFTIEMMDPARAPALTINAETDVGDAQAILGPPQTRLVIPLNDLVFMTEGTYDFELQVGEERVALAPLHLIRDVGVGLA